MPHSTRRYPVHLAYTSSLSQHMDSTQLWDPHVVREVMYMLDTSDNYCHSTSWPCLCILSPPSTCEFVMRCMIFWQPSRNVQEETYSLFTIFKNSQEAHQAYENVKGSQEKVCTVDDLFQLTILPAWHPYPLLVFKL